MLKVTGSGRLVICFEFFKNSPCQLLREWVPDSLQNWGRWSQEEEEWHPHLSYTIVSTRWLSNSQSPTRPLAQGQPLSFFTLSLTVKHNVQFHEFHVDWYSAQEVYMFSESASSRVYRYVTNKLSIQKGMSAGDSFPLYSIPVYQVSK